MCIICTFTRWPHGFVLLLLARGDTVAPSGRHLVKFNHFDFASINAKGKFIYKMFSIIRHSLDKSPIKIDCSSISKDEKIEAGLRFVTLGAFHFA